jgi:hypothetical protein
MDLKKIAFALIKDVYNQSISRLQILPMGGE